jgi:dephospho-CoA kinase
MQGPIEKIEEELLEFKQEVLALAQLPKVARLQQSQKNKVEAELGDLLFSLCNIASLMKINPEDSLRSTLNRFQKRFHHVEARLKEIGKTPEESDLIEMDSFWKEAKKIENVQIWGLTGGIASGKSTVARLFSELGVPVLDADLISREILDEKGEAYETVLRRFGTTDRAHLKKMIFSDSKAKTDLEGILHPFIYKKSEEKIRSLALHQPILIYEASLLIETEKDRHQTEILKKLEGIIVVEAPRDIRLKRLLSREKISLELANQIIDSQLPENQRRASADFIIENSGSLEYLKKRVQDLKNKIWTLSRLE